jgi:Uncharacterized protein conserved in bacteria
MPERKTLLVRVDPAVHEALVRWAADELRSTNAHVELLLRSALFRAGRLPPNVGELPRRGRPPKAEARQVNETPSVGEFESSLGDFPDRSNHK